MNKFVLFLHQFHYRALIYNCAQKQCKNITFLSIIVEQLMNLQCFLHTFQHNCK